MYEITHISLGQKSPYGLIPGNVGIISTAARFSTFTNVGRRLTPPCALPSAPT